MAPSSGSRRHPPQWVLSKCWRKGENEDLSLQVSQSFSSFWPFGASTGARGQHPHPLAHTSKGRLRGSLWGVRVPHLGRVRWLQTPSSQWPRPVPCFSLGAFWPPPPYMKRAFRYLIHYTPPGWEACGGYFSPELRQSSTFQSSCRLPQPPRGPSSEPRRGLSRAQHRRLTHLQPSTERKLRLRDSLRAPAGTSPHTLHLNLPPLKLGSPYVPPSPSQNTAFLAPLGRLPHR